MSPTQAGPMISMLERVFTTGRAVCGNQRLFGRKNRFPQ
jgi:hypothetical protein